MSLLSLILLTPLCFWLAAVTLPDTLRRWVGALSTMGFVAWLVAGNALHSPPERLLAASLWLLYFIKGWSLLLEPREQVKGYSRPGLLLFSYLWPGVDPRPFQKRGAADESAAGWFVAGFPTMCLGIFALAMLVLLGSGLQPIVRGLLGVMCLLAIVHLGYSDILSCVMRLVGFPVERLFRSPLALNSLDDFWTHRWNGPFVEMNRRLFKPLLRPLFSSKVTIFSLFLISGLLHELALSYPVARGFGGPLLYFVCQGLGLRLERRWKPGLARRVLAWTFLVLPLPLLFHRAFLQALVLPFLDYLSQWPPLSSPQAFWPTLLRAAGYGHFLVLLASFQVPHRLNWGEELQRLRPLNRKLLWTYGGYIATFILLWGVITLNLTPEMLAGDKSALVIVALIALFWWSRIVIDAFYFQHDDWPEGVEFVIGHTCLTTLFVTLACTYSAVLWRGLSLL